MTDTTFWIGVDPDPTDGGVRGVPTDVPTESPIPTMTQTVVPTTTHPGQLPTTGPSDAMITSFALGLGLVLVGLVAMATLARRRRTER